MTSRVMASGSERMAALSLRALVLSFLLWTPSWTIAQDPQPAEGEAKTEESQADESTSGDAEARPTAWFVKRILLGNGTVIDDAVLVVKDGKVQAVGASGKVEIPENARRIDAKSRTMSPGFVHPASHASFAGDRFSFAGTSSKSDESILPKFDPTRKDLAHLARSGFTTVALVPDGGGFTGQGILIRPIADGKGLVDVSKVLRQDNAVLAMGFEPGTATREAWQKAFEKARQYLTDLDAWNKSKKEGGKSEEKKSEPKPSDEKKPEEKKPEEQKSGDTAKPEEKKTDEKKGEEKKQEEKKPEEKKVTEPSKDPKVMPLVDVFERRMPGVLALGGAGSFLHFESLFRSESSFRPALYFPSTSPADMDSWRVIEKLVELQLPVILPAVNGAVPLTANRRVVTRMMRDAGVPVALVPSLDRFSSFPEFRFQLLEMLRHGWSEADLLKAVTSVPAQMLGIQNRVGSLEVGKDADFLLFNGAPFAPTTALVRAVVSGESVYEIEGDVP